jgi:hypothetical protein
VRWGDFLKKRASWYIDQGLKKRDERRGGERQIKGLNLKI